MPGGKITKSHAGALGKHSLSSSIASTPSASLASAKKPRGKHRNKKESRHNDNDDTSSTSADMGPSPVRSTDTPPKDLFLSSTVADKLMGTEITVSALVGTRLFPQIKFLCNPTVELMFCRDDRSICGVVMAECSPPITIAEQDWWEHARKWIGKQVSVLRNSKNTQMKWSFMGKS